MNDSNPDDIGKPKRKPIWPWLFLLVVTLAVIFAYERATEIYEDVLRDIDGIIDFVNWLLPERLP